MRKSGICTMFALALLTSACAKNEDVEEGVPADTATMAPAPAPMPMPMPMDTMMMDSMTHDTMQMTTTN